VVTFESTSGRRKPVGNIFHNILMEATTKKYSALISSKKSLELAMTSWKIPLLNSLIR
jgi:hypothetical protein